MDAFTILKTNPTTPHVISFFCRLLWLNDRDSGHFWAGKINKSEIEVSLIYCKGTIKMIYRLPTPTVSVCELMHVKE